MRERNSKCEKERYEILKAGFVTYDNLKLLEKQNKRPFYRPPWYFHTVDSVAKKVNKWNWFRKKNNNFTTVIFVNATPNGELIQRMRHIEEQYQIASDKRILFVERPGAKVVEQISLSDPFRQNCTDSECLACKNSKSFTHCRKANVGYSLICKLCDSRGILKTYEGETCRNIFLRGKEHLRSYKTNNQNSVMRKHVIDEHATECENVDFQIKVRGTFQTPLSRIINEGIRIKNIHPKDLLNSKNEHFGLSIARKILKN